MFISLAHSDKDIDFTISSVASAFEKV